jgi:hypothetical protein
MLSPQDVLEKILSLVIQGSNKPQNRFQADLFERNYY